MGTYSKGANGNFSGKVGSVVGSKWRSINYLKSLPEPSSKQASVPQMAQRARFALAPLYLRPIKDILNIGFGDKRLNKQTGYNAAVKIFLMEAITGDYPFFTIDFSRIVLSKGSLSVFHGLTAALSGSDIVLNWQSILNRFNAFDDDQLLVVLYNADKSMYQIYEDPMRSDLSYNISMGADFAGDTIHTYAFALNRDNATVSNSQYLGQLIIP